MILLTLSSVTGVVCPAWASSETTASASAAVSAPVADKLSFSPDLTVAQRNTLDAFIQRDLKAAKDGGVRAFRDTFSARLTPADLAKSGLDELPPATIAQIDHDVAKLIAASGSPTDPLAAQRYTPKKTPESFAIPKLPLEVHGSLTAVYGTSKLGDYYGAGATTTVFDPNRGWSATIGVSSLRGDIPWASSYPYRQDVTGSVITPLWW
mgnify:FL=1